MGFGVGSGRCAGGAGTGERLPVQPSDNVLFDVAYRCLFPCSELAEARTFAVKTPDFERVPFDPEHVGSLLIG